MTNLIIFIITSVVLGLIANSAKNSGAKKQENPNSTEHNSETNKESENPLQRMLRSLEKELMHDDTLPTQHHTETPIRMNDIPPVEPTDDMYNKTECKAIVAEKKESAKNEITCNNKRNEDIMDDFTVEKAVIYSAILRPKYLDF